MRQHQPRCRHVQYRSASWVGVTVTTNAWHNHTEGGDARRLAGDNSDAERHRRSIDDKEAYARTVCIF